MTNMVPLTEPPNGLEVLPLVVPIPTAELRELIALDAALMDELGARFSTERWGAEEFTMALPRKWDFSRVAYRAGHPRVVGYWIVSLRDEGELHTHRVGVTTTSRRTGVGRALYAAVATEAATRGIHTMTLSLNQDNEAALRFYRSLGFVPLVEEDLERFLRSKASRVRIDTTRRRFMLDDVSYLVLSRDLLGGTT